MLCALLQLNVGEIGLMMGYEKVGDGKDASCCGGTRVPGWCLHHRQHGRHLHLGFCDVACCGCMML